MQRREWHDLALDKVRSMYDPETCRQVIEKFFEVIEDPQLHDLPRPPPKKHARAVGVWGDREPSDEPPTITSPPEEPPLAQKPLPPA